MRRRVLLEFRVLPMLARCREGTCNEPGNPKIRTKDEWLRLVIWKVILDRAWG